jgi:hypothetical protein
MSRYFGHYRAHKRQAITGIALWKERKHGREPDIGQSLRAHDGEYGPGDVGEYLGREYRLSDAGWAGHDGAAALGDGDCERLDLGLATDQRPGQTSTHHRGRYTVAS